MAVCLYWPVSWQHNTLLPWLGAVSLKRLDLLCVINCPKDGSVHVLLLQAVITIQHPVQLLPLSRYTANLYRLRYDRKAPTRSHRDDTDCGDQSCRAAFPVAVLPRGPDV